MRIRLVAVGRLKEGAERDLFDRYASRFDQVGRQIALGPLQVVEVPEGKARNAAQRKSSEAASLLASAAQADLVIALEGRGRQMTSESFAAWLGARRDTGAGTAAILIGGPDGHGEPVLARAGLELSLGQMTLPHTLARVMLAEQLYRAATILAGHPYHRS
jgi:23S rRNA (pseudouridine1915-N3)-methyltransferase